MPNIEKSQKSIDRASDLKQNLFKKKTRLSQIKTFLINFLAFNHNYHKSSLRVSEEFVRNDAGKVLSNYDIKQIPKHEQIISNYSSALEIYPKIKNILEENEINDPKQVEDYIPKLLEYFNFVDKYILPDCDRQVLMEWFSLDVNAFEINKASSITAKVNLFKDESKLEKLSEILELLKKPLIGLDLVSEKYSYNQIYKERIASMQTLDHLELENLAKNFDCDFTQFANKNNNFEIFTAKLLSRFGNIISKVFSYKVSVTREDIENFQNEEKILYISLEEIKNNSYLSQFYINNFTHRAGLKKTKNSREIYEDFTQTLKNASNANSANLEIWSELFKIIGFEIKLQPLKELINKLKLDDLTYEISDDTIDQIFDLATVDVFGNYNTGKR